MALLASDRALVEQQLFDCWAPVVTKIAIGIVIVAVCLVPGLGLYMQTLARWEYWIDAVQMAVRIIYNMYHEQSNNN